DQANGRGPPSCAGREPDGEVSSEIAAYDRALLAGHQVLLGRDLTRRLGGDCLGSGARAGDGIARHLILCAVGRPLAATRTKLLRHLDHLTGRRQAVRRLADAVDGAVASTSATLLTRATGGPRLTRVGGAIQPVALLRLDRARRRPGASAALRLAIG